MRLKDEFKDLASRLHTELQGVAVVCIAFAPASEEAKQEEIQKIEQGDLGPIVGAYFHLPFAIFAILSLLLAQVFIMMREKLMP